MGRLHLFELEDFSWYPTVLRDMETDLLQFGINTFGLYDRITPQVAALLREANVDDVVDLCSGGSGPWIRLRPALEAELGRPPKVTLTDKFPNLPALERARRLAGVEFRSESVDATAVPDDLTGVRTLFSSFHHFRPELGRAILRDAFERRRPIAVFEGTARLPHEVLRFVLSAPLTLLFTPFVRPFRLSRFLFTYLIPIVPLVALWDGFVSCLRTYSPAELEELVSDMQAEDYRWEAVRITRLFLPSLTYLIGRPTSAVAEV